MSDLSDAEFAELDALLAETPQPYRPLDAVMLDGYLCGVLVQPRLIDEEQWLPRVFDADGAAFPASADAGWRARCEALIRRRHDALRVALVEDGGFDPLLPQVDEGSPAEEAADPRPASDPIARTLGPWVAGFALAASAFTDLLALEDAAVFAALARLYRHLPLEVPPGQEARAAAERAPPSDSLDDAIDELVATVVELAGLTHDARWRVETVRRAAPKTGRNAPCPCGSGRKFKLCHGAS